MKIIDAVILFKALSDPLRLRLVLLLAATQDQELCNCEFVDALEEPQPTVSRHLRMLTQAGVLHERREGRWNYYRLATEDPDLIPLFALVGTVQAPQGPEDRRRLRERLGLRQHGKCVLGVQKKHLLSGAAS